MNDAARECAEEVADRCWPKAGPRFRSTMAELLLPIITKHFPPSVPCDELRALAQNWITKANMLRWENGKMEAKDLIEIISKYEATK